MGSPISAALGAGSTELSDQVLLNTHCAATQGEGPWPLNDNDKEDSGILKPLPLPRLQASCLLSTGGEFTVLSLQRRAQRLRAGGLLDLPAPWGCGPWTVPGRRGSRSCRCGDSN